MAQTQSETLTRRDALAKGAALLGASTFGATTFGPATFQTGTFATAGLSADEPKSPRKVRIGVVGGNFGLGFQWHQHPNCVVTGVTDLRADRRELLRNVYKCDRVYDSMEIMLAQARDIDAVAIFTEAPNHVPHCVAAPTSSAPAPRCTAVAKASSRSRSLLTSRTMSCCSIPCAAACTSLRSASVSVVFGFTNMAMVAAKPRTNEAGLVGNRPERQEDMAV